jgi:tetratricopeptide (TPR) repeat protein/predicted regulator of Ras-like GTPase activity (Roadblock/LC7/MglB family)
MLNLDFAPKLVGREENLEELQAYLEMAVEGFGSTVFLAGEAGIGKTRLIEEVKSDAESKGFQVLSGYGLYESLTPYMPFMDALRSGALEHLFAERSPMIEGLYLVTKTGLLIQETIREETELDSDLFASMLTTVGNFVRDTLTQLRGEKSLDTLNKLGYGDCTILVESGDNTYLAAIITGEENEFLISDMRDALVAVDRRYGQVLEKWDGDEEKVKGIEGFLNPLISSGKYDGVYHGRDDPQSRRNLLFENVSLGLQRQAQTTPTLLCLEDLQWADPSSLSLMHYVARNTRKCKLLILGTYRPEDILVEEGRHHPLVDTMQLMGREELFKKLELGRLPEESMTEFLTSILGRLGFGQEFQGRIYKETEGNPLYIIELTKLLIDEGILKESDGIWNLSKGWEEVNIPSKVCDVIVRRLNRVEAEDRRVLDYASVVGDVFRSETLSGALKLERVQLLERLRVLEKSHKLVHAHDGVFRFDHAKVREVLYSELPRELRMEYHSIVAHSIEEMNIDNLEEVVGDLAFHYKHCKDKEKAPRYLTKVAEEAKNNYANEEAIRFYGEALEFEDEDLRRAEILQRMGAVYELIGDYDRSIEAYQSSLQIVQDRETKADIGRRIASVYEHKGDYEDSISAYREALDLVRGDGSDNEANIVLGIGNLHWCKGEYDEAREHYVSALDIGKKIDDKLIIAASLTNIGNININDGEYGDALENYEKSLQLRESAGDERRAAHTLGNIGALYHNRGDYKNALRNYEKSLEILEKIGDQQGIAVSLNNIGVLHEARGEYEKALQRYEKSLEIMEKVGDQAAIASSLHNVGLVHRYLGDCDLALENYQKSMDLCVKIGYQIGVAFNCAGIAEVYLEKKDLDNALAFCDRAYESSEEMGVKEYAAASKRIYGMIYRERKDWNKSIENFEDSIRILSGMGRDKELGESHYEYGLMWKMKRDADKAGEHLRKATEVFESLDLNRELENAREALKDLE